MTYEYNQDHCAPGAIASQITGRQEAGWEFVAMTCTPMGLVITIYRRPITGTDHK